MFTDFTARWSSYDWMSITGLGSEYPRSRTLLHCQRKLASHDESLACKPPFAEQTPHRTSRSGACPYCTAELGKLATASKPCCSMVIRLYLYFWTWNVALKSCCCRSLCQFKHHRLLRAGLNRLLWCPICAVHMLLFIGTFCFARSLQQCLILPCMYVQSFKRPHVQTLPKPCPHLQTTLTRRECWTKPPSPQVLQEGLWQSIDTKHTREKLRTETEQY